MRHFFLFLLAMGLGISTVVAQKKAPMADLDLQPNGKYYQRNHVEAFTGVAIEEFPNGRKKAKAEFKDGQLHGKVTTWHETGAKATLVFYEKGVRTKTETHWYDTGAKKLEIGYDENGLASGICKEYYPNEQLKSEGKYVKGLEEGLHKWYFKNGKIEQTVAYKNGLANGLIKHYYPEGQLKMKGDYQAGKPHGVTTFFHKNGQRKQSISYQMGVEEGQDSLWSARGWLLEVRSYKNGEEQSYENFRSGAIKTKEGYLQVFNEAQSYFSIHIEHPGWVRTRASRDITYVVDDFVLQLFNTPITTFTAEKELSDEEILERHLKYEQQFIEENTDATLDIQKEFRSYHNGKYLYWQFESPSLASTTNRSKYTVVREHYFTFVCDQQVLTLYVPQVQDNDAQKIQSAIAQMANSIQVENSRIDLNQVRKEIRQNNGLPALPANETFDGY